MAGPRVYCWATGKVCHRSAAKARSTLAALKSKGRRKRGHRGKFNIYCCPFCQMWHFGHRRPDADLGAAGEAS